MGSYDPAALVRKARITEDYCFSNTGVLDDDEAMRCASCGFRSNLPGTPVFAWVRHSGDVKPAVIELCEICNAAANIATRL